MKVTENRLTRTMVMTSEVMHCVKHKATGEAVHYFIGGRADIEHQQLLIAEMFAHSTNEYIKFVDLDALPDPCDWPASDDALFDLFDTVPVEFMNGHVLFGDDLEYPSD